MEKTSVFSPARIGFYILSLAVFCLVIRYAGKLKDIEDLVMKMSTTWLLLALISQAATYIFNVLILRTLLKGHTGNTGFLKLLKLSVVILFINQALPTGGISGNGYIFRQLVKRRVPPQSAFDALILESICYYIAFLMLLACFYEWYARQSLAVSPIMRYTALSGFIFFTFLGTIMLLVSNKRAIAFFLPKLERIGWFKRYFEQSGLFALSKGKETTWKDLFKDKSAIMLTIACQICILSCDGLTIFAILQGFHILLDTRLIMLGLLLSLVIGSLPVSPGGLIAYESAMTYFYMILGVPVHAALIITLLFRFFSFWLPIPFGLLFYRNLSRV